MQDFYAVIPARYASTRLPGKPLADIAGKPMVVRVAERALASGARGVWVATDHEAVAAAVRAHGYQVCLTSPDCASGTDRLAEVATQLAWPDEAVVVNVQGDEPLIDPALLQAVAQRLHDRPDCAMATAAHPLSDAAELFNPNVVKVVLDARETALLFSRAPIPWWRDAPRHDDALDLCAWPAGLRPLRHIGLYAYRAGFLRTFPTLPPAPLEQCEALEQLRVLWHGQRIAVHITPEAPGPGVDTPDDLARVRALWAARHAARR